MNLASYIILAVIIIMVLLAIRYIHKNGTCVDCPEHGRCTGHCSTGAYKKDPNYKEKSKQIDQIIKKHGL